MSKIGDGEVNRLVDLTWNDPWQETRSGLIVADMTILLCYVSTKRDNKNQSVWRDHLFSNRARNCSFVSLCAGASFLSVPSASPAADCFCVFVFVPVTKARGVSCNLLLCGMRATERELAPGRDSASLRSLRSGGLLIATDSVFPWISSASAPTKAREALASSS